MVPPCDHECVGVVIPDAGDTYWLLDRGKPPPGWAGVGDHLDDHGGPEAAARAKTLEELSITVVSLIPAFEDWLPNWCRRRHQPRKLGHHWHLFIAEWRGQPTPEPEEARGLRRFHRRQLQVLAERTAAYAIGDVTPPQFAADPGLELPWAYWAHRLGLVDLPRDVLSRIIDRSALPPDVLSLNSRTPS
ncbi:NUDIX domain-containing protein [Nonomuraea sp. NPDC049504]|uniref:NUDIX hydrolase n=1 Tax=Nonomuraea sp. NPDC049504 TaxID=3154729 RepID=UPI0034495BFF